MDDYEICAGCGEEIPEGWEIDGEIFCGDCTPADFEPGMIWCASCGDEAADPEIGEATGERLCVECFEAMKDAGDVCYMCGASSQYILPTGVAACADCADELALGQ